MDVCEHLGETLEFEDYVRRRHNALLRTARRLVPDPLDAQDLLQTALARTYDRWNGIADKQRADAYLEQMSTEETAVALGTSIGTVKSTLHRSLALLREELERRDHETAPPHPPTGCSAIGIETQVKEP